MRYRAFFSYARADDRIANWLHRQLDGYRTPKPLVGTDGDLGPVPVKLHPIFRDRTDLESGGHVDQALQQALEDSETLIVLCTPTSAKSHWVNHEVETFLKLGREAAIFPVIAAGVPDSGDPETECFPPALRGKGLLAADLREIKLPTGQLVGDGRDGGRLKLIAGLLGVKLDALVQRERRRQRQVVAALGVAALVFLGVAAVAGLQTLAANANLSLALKNEREAKRQQGIAETNAAKERAAREAEKQQRELADENARQTEIQRLLADRNAFEAQSTLHRFFATQSWARKERGDYLSAARYALVGMRLAPDNRDRYWSALAGIMHDAGEALPPLIHRGQVMTATFSADGKRILTESSFGTGLPAYEVRVWNVADGLPLFSLKGLRSSGIVSEFSPDGRRIATAGPYEVAGILDHRSTIRVWDALDGNLIATLGQSAGRAHTVTFSPDGRRLVTANGDNTATIWDAIDFHLIATLSGHQDSVTTVSFSSDGLRVATGSEDATAKIWDATTGRLLETLVGNAGAIRSAKFSPDNTRLITAGDDNNPRVWNTADGQLIATLSGHTAGTRIAAFSPDGQRIVTAGFDHTARIWATSSGGLVATLSGHQGAINSAVFSPDGQSVITASPDKTVRVWNAATGSPITVFSGHVGNIYNAAYSPDGRRIVTASSDNTAKIWDAMGSRPRTTFTRHANTVRSAAFSRDGRRIVTASWDGTAKIWNAQDGHLIASLIGHQREVVSAAFSPDGRRIVTGSWDGTAKIWNSSDGRLLSTIAASGSVRSVSFSPDGRRVLFASGATPTSSPAASIWDIADGHVIAMVEVQGGILAANFSPDGRRIITASSDRTAKVWSAEAAVPNDRRLLVTLVGHAGPVQSAAFSPDGRHIVTGSSDKTARLWDATSGAPIVTFSGHSVTVYSAAFSPDGTEIVTSSSDRTAAIWNARRLTQPWDTLARDACTNLLGPFGRFFPQAEIDADQLLIAEWRADRDVCEGVPGVPSIAELRRRAGLPAVAPAR